MLKEYHGVLSVENGNLMYDKRIFDNVRRLIVKNNRTFKYDQKSIQCWIFLALKAFNLR
jgi:hypothetical protein